MSRFHNLPFHQKLQDHSLLKVISGLNNFDNTSVAQISSAAGIGGADLIDIACSPELVQLSLSVSSVPVCVSSVEPQLFPDAVEAGASMIEIGNYDSFYPKGRFFDAGEVLDLTKRSRSLLSEIPLSVTVPHFLPLSEQAELALDLVDAGADCIQTEGGTVVSPKNPGVLGLIEKASPTLAAVHTIAKSFSEVKCKVPLICASGLSEITVNMAIAAGASGVGIGSAINRLNNEIEMIAMVKTLREAIDSFNLILKKSFL